MYVTKTSAPRDVYAAKLKGTMKKKSIDSIFKRSGSFHSTDKNEFDVLIVDEAHRLNEKSGLFSNLGENNNMMHIVKNVLKIYISNAATKR
ncbi:DNA/RNA helicase domain-containing protein [Psychrobacillus sp. NPDC058041]|uniref:DNA/RNA helicase domain-containing protein n=1 Tax=Psychrobacillus sp. NPDC058041 TaxID=3346310 RepID=UPI0036DC7AE7